MKISSVSSVQFSRSVVSDSLRPMNRSTPGLPGHHQFSEFTQTHVHQVSDTYVCVCVCVYIICGINFTIVSIFFFVARAFGVLCRNHYYIQQCKDFLLCFKSFVVWARKFKFLTHFELIFMYDVR